MNRIHMWTCLTLACGLLTASKTHADGFFRRLPEVGESATYETVLLVTNDGIEGFDIPELSGTLTVQCVGKTTIDDTQYYWIEVLLTLQNSTNPSLESTWKILVAESDLENGDPIAHYSRGWQSRSADAPPMEMTAESLADITNPTPLILRAVLLGPEAEPENVDQSQTVMLDGQEVQIDEAEHGDFALVELSGESDSSNSMTGWGTWWLHENAAFGVAQAEQLWTIIHSEAGELDYALQFTLTETRSDAVSVFPDHQ